MSIRLALVDAAKNCAERGATATITLKSGVQFKGKLQRASAITDTHELRIDSGLGWVTFLVSEVAAVEASVQ